MNLPRVLVVDDQYATDAAEKSLFLRRISAVEADIDGNPPNDKSVAQITICSGQRQFAGQLVNDYAVVQEAVGNSDDWALILLDVTFDSGSVGKDGIPAGQEGDDYFGEQIRASLAGDFPDLPVVMLSSKRQEELQDRQTPYVSKAGLNEAIFRAVLLQHGNLTIDQQRDLLGLDDYIAAEAEETFAVYREAFLHATSYVSILILGETGTGKEVLARYIHRISRRSGPFVDVNISAIPKELLEAELFGIEKGTATGVIERAGKFESAQTGTLFLDEIGDMPLEAQAKLLRALQERKICRVGGRNAISLNIRLICATSRDLKAMITNETLRKDLYYRINTVPLVLPPLRQRKNDIIPLSDRFFQKAMSATGKYGIRFSDKAVRLLFTYPFPGNIRELENLVFRLVSSAGNHQILQDGEVGKKLGLSGAVSTPGQRSSELAAVSSTKSSLTTDSKASGVQTLDALLNLIEGLKIDKDNPDLFGARAKLQQAYGHVMQRLAGASLERCRNSVTGKLNRQGAMRLLTGDKEMRGKEPLRIINEILGRKQNHLVTEEDLEYLVAFWKETDNKSE